MAKELFLHEKGSHDITFEDDGTLSVHMELYDHIGELELSEEETKKLYLAMKKYYNE